MTALTAARLGQHFTPEPCEPCGAPSVGCSYDEAANRLHWYCREHHPMMPGGVARITGTATGTPAFGSPDLLPGHGWGASAGARR